MNGNFTATVLCVFYCRYHRTARNPYNHQCYPGGSSSGSAVAVAAGELQICSVPQGSVIGPLYTITSGTLVGSCSGSAVVVPVGELQICSVQQGPVIGPLYTITLVTQLTKIYAVPSHGCGLVGLKETLFCSWLCLFGFTETRKAENKL